jgi:hypothetical protein
MFFQTRKSKKYNKGWHVVCAPDSLDESLPEEEKDESYEKFALDDNLYVPIMQYYVENKDPYLTIVRPDEDASKDEPEVVDDGEGKDGEEDEEEEDESDEE